MLAAMLGSAGIMVDREDMEESELMEDMDEAVNPGDGAELEVPFPADSLEK